MKLSNFSLLGLFVLNFSLVAMEHSHKHDLMVAITAYRKLASATPEALLQAITNAGKSGEKDAASAGYKRCAETIEGGLTNPLFFSAVAQSYAQQDSIFWSRMYKHDLKLRYKESSKTFGPDLRDNHIHIHKLTFLSGDDNAVVAAICNQKIATYGVGNPHTSREKKFEINKGDFSPTKKYMAIMHRPLSWDYQVALLKVDDFSVVYDVALPYTPSNSYPGSVCVADDGSVFFHYSDELKKLSSDKKSCITIMDKVNGGKLLVARKKPHIAIQEPRFINIYDVAQGSLEQKIKFEENAWVQDSFLMTDDSTLLTVRDYKNLHMIDMRNGKVARTMQASWATRIAASADNRIIVSGSEHDGIKLWDSCSGKIITTFPYCGSLYQITINDNATKLLAVGCQVVAAFNLNDFGDEKEPKPRSLDEYVKLHATLTGIDERDSIKI